MIGPKMNLRGTYLVDERFGQIPPHKLTGQRTPAYGAKLSLARHPRALDVKLLGITRDPHAKKSQNFG